VKNLAKSILNYYSTYNETRFRFDTRINFAWTNDDRTLDIPFFPDVAKNMLNEIQAGRRINLLIHPEEHSISLDKNAFIEELSTEAQNLFSLLPDTFAPSDQDAANALRQFNLELRKKVQAIQYNMQTQKIAELQNLHGTSYQPKTSFNPSINEQLIYDSIQREINVTTEIGLFKEAVLQTIKNGGYTLILFDLFAQLRDFDRKVGLDRVYLFAHQISNEDGSYPLYFIELTINNQFDSISLTQTQKIIYLNTPAINANKPQDVLTLPRAEEMSNALTTIRQLNGFLNTIYHGPQDFLIQDKFPRMSLPSYPEICSRIGFQIVKQDSNNLLDYSELLALSDSTVGQKFLKLIDQYINSNVPSTQKEIEQQYRDKYAPRDVWNIVDDNPFPLNKSQKKILLAAQNEKNKIIVVEGPPGTGKSHTISALVYMASGMGRSVLITSHKKQALDVIEGYLTDKFRRLNQTGKPAIIRMDKANEGIANPPAQTLANPALNGAANRVQKTDIDVIEQRIQATLDRIIEQNQAYWQQLNLAVSAKSLISDYLALESNLQLPVCDRLIENFTEQDVSDLLIFFKKLQSIDFPISYQHLRDYFQKRDSYEYYRKALEHLNSQTTTGTEIVINVDITSLHTISQSVKELALSVKGSFKVFQDELEQIKLRWGDRFLPRADELEQLTASIDAIEKHSGLLSGKDSKKKREEEEQILEQDHPEFYEHVFKSKKIKDTKKYLADIVNKLDQHYNGSQYTKAYLLTEHKNTNTERLKHIIQQLRQVDHAELVDLISAIAGVPKEELTLDQIVKGIDVLDSQTQSGQAMVLVQELAEMLQTEVSDIPLLNTRLKKVHAVVEDIQQNDWDRFGYLYVTYSSWLTHLGITLADVNAWKQVTTEKIENMLKLILLQKTLAAISGTSKPAQEDVQEFYHLIHQKFEYQNDQRYSDLLNYAGDIGQMQTSILTRKRLSSEQTSVMNQHLSCVIAQPSLITDFFPMEEDIFDYLIIDEASQVSIADSLSLILRAKQVIIFGDELQYGAVSAVNVAEHYASAYFKDIIRSYSKDQNFHVSEEDADRLSREVSKAKVEEDDEEISQIFLPSAGKIEWLKTFSIRTSTLAFCQAMANYSSALDVHFRSFQEIISYSSKFFYKQNSIDLIINRIRTKPIKQVLRFIRVETKTHSSSNVNLDEIEVILRELKELYEQNFQGTIGVICSFKEQQVRMDKEFRNKNYITHLKADNNLKVWFVGDVQGEERDLIFYSFVQDDKFKTADLRTIYPVVGGTADNIRKLKMQRLNVGFSRAKDTMVFVHSMPLEKYNDTTLGAALQHYQEQLENTRDNYIEDESVFDSPAEKELYNLITQTEFYQKHKDKIKLVAQFEIGKYLEEQYQRYIPKYRVDFLLTLSQGGRERSLILEYDGFEYHFDPNTPHDPQYLEYDLARQLELESYGYKFLRINKFNLLPTDPAQTKISTLNKYLEQALEE